MAVPVKVRHIKRTVQVKGYSEAGASYSRRALRSFIGRSGSPAEDIDANNGTLRERSRLLVMSTPLAAAAINTNRTKVVGTGLVLQSTVKREILGLTPEAAKLWQRQAEAEFSMWAGKKQNCDALGINNFAGIQQLALVSWLKSGDVFVVTKFEPPTRLNPYSLRLQVIEADRCSTPDGYALKTRSGVTEGKVPDGMPGAGHKVYDGVEVDEVGKVVAYYFCDSYPNQYVVANRKWTRVLAYGEETGLPNVLHIMCSERPDQYRGVPYLAPVIEPLLQMRRYTEAEIMAAIVQSFYTAWIKTSTDPSQLPFNEVGVGDTGEGEDNISNSENEYEMGPGTVTHLKEGEDIVFGNPNIPTAGFETFIKMFCKLVGAALDLPYDVLLKEFNSSYSASRGALLEAWEAIKMRRAWLIDDLCRPVYELFICEAVARGRLRAPGFFVDPVIRDAWLEAKWIGPAQGSLDPKKEVEAAILQVDNAFKTRTQATREMGGGDYMENVEQLGRENEALKTAGGGSVRPTADLPDDGDDGGDAE